MALWLVRADPATVEPARVAGVIGLGVRGLTDLTAVSTSADAGEVVRATVPHARRAARRAVAASIHAFVRRIADRDLVALPTADAVWFGRVTGAYRYDETAPTGIRHQRPVEWLRAVRWEDLDPEIAAAVRTSGDALVTPLRASSTVRASAAAEPSVFSRRKFLVGALGAGTAAAVAGLLHPWESGSGSGGVARPLVDRAGRAPKSGRSIYAKWVRAENAKPGTSDWNLDNGGTNQIEGYASQVSAVRGETVTIYVSTQAPTFTAQAYRMGYYQGHGGRLVWSSGTIPGARQAAPTITPGTNMVEANWNPSFELTLTSQFPPGVYLIKLQGADGFQHHVPLTVRDDSSEAAYLVQNSVTSWQAYNQWGGYSLYYGVTGRGQDFAHRARIVSFERPYDKGDGSSDFLGLEHPLIMLMEQMGLDVTYTTDVDVHQNPNLLLRHRSFWSLGHDEYWSLAMRNGAEAARDAGVNLAFLGANAAFRQIRFEPSARGPNRHQVCYKSAAEDPLSTTDPALTTVNWRDPPVSRPESIMIGEQYESNPVSADLVFVDPSSWVLAGTNIKAGAIIPVGVGTEYDRYYPNQAGPHNVTIIAHSPLVCNGRPSYADMTYYSAPSGAGVFASGTIYWITKVSQPGPGSDYNPLAVAVTKNLLTVFGAGPAGEKFPSVSNYAQIAGNASTTPPTIPNSA